MGGLSRYMEPDWLSSPQLPMSSESMAKKPEPARPPGMALTQAQSRGVYSGYTPMLVSVQPCGCDSKSSKNRSLYGPPSQSGGGSLASSGWKSQGGSPRSSVAIVAS